MRLHVATRAAGVVAAACVGRAVDRLRERDGDGALADALGPGKQQALRHAAARDRLAEQRDDGAWPMTSTKRHALDRC